MTKVFLRTVQILVLSGLFFSVSCKKDEKKDDGGGGTNQSPTCTITNPLNNATFSTDENIAVTVVAEDADGTIAEVQLYLDNEGYDGTNSFPYNFTISAGKLATGTHTLKAVAIDNQGAKAESTISIIINEPPEPTLKIGNHYQGGIIFYIDETGKHGLIAAPQDQSTGIMWYNGSNIVTGADGIAIGTGRSNTTKIVQMQGEGSYAAKLCDDLVLNGYSDWFLPSKYELNILYQNRNLIGGFFTMDETSYWSSSEDLSYDAWCQQFTNGNQSYGYKSDAHRVRAIRAF